MKNPIIKHINIDTQTGCWNWTATLHRGGYGLTWANKKVRKAHRVSYQLYYGEFDETLYVLHKCDNRKCVNPEHLFLGTALDNARDMISKNRHLESYSKIQFKKGELHPSAKITTKDVEEIRKLIDSRIMTQTKIAASYGISSMQVSRIKYKKNWE